MHLFLWWSNKWVIIVDPTTWCKIRRWYRCQLFGPESFPLAAAVIKSNISPVIDHLPNKYLSSIWESQLWERSILHLSNPVKIWDCKNSWLCWQMRLDVSPVSGDEGGVGPGSSPLSPSTDIRGEIFAGKLRKFHTCWNCPGFRTLINLFEHLKAVRTSSFDFVRSTLWLTDKKYWMMMLIYLMNWQKQSLSSLYCSGKVMMDFTGKFDWEIYCNIFCRHYTKSILAQMTPRVNVKGGTNEWASINGQRSLGCTNLTNFSSPTLITAALLTINQQIPHRHR